MSARVEPVAAPGEALEAPKRRPGGASILKTIQGVFPVFEDGTVTVQGQLRVVPARARASLYGPVEPMVVEARVVSLRLRMHGGRIGDLIENSTIYVQPDVESPHVET